MTEPSHEKMCLIPSANNKGADQPAHARSLINAFIIRCQDRMILLVCISEISRFSLVSVAEQISLCLVWSETPEDTFCHDVRKEVTTTTKKIAKQHLDRVKRIWYLSPMRAAKVQASPRIRAVSPEPPLLAHTSSESRGTFRQKARSLAPLNGWAYAVKICNDGMLEDTNSLDGAHLKMMHGTL